MNEIISNEVIIGTLTADCVKALRQADQVCFHRVDGEGTISGIKRVKNKGPWEDRERYYKIQCESTVDVFDENTPYEGRKHFQERAQCFHMIFSSNTSEEWRTIAAFLKKGDVVRLHWSADGRMGGYVKRAKVVERDESAGDAGLGMSLHVDTLYLKVVRGKETYSFMVDFSVCPDNSARMIRG